MFVSHARVGKGWRKGRKSFVCIQHQDFKKKVFENKEFPNSDQDFLTWQSCCMDQGRNNWLTFFFLTNTKAMSKIWILSPLPHAPGKEELARKICKFKMFFLQFFSNWLIRSRKKEKIYVLNMAFTKEYGVLCMTRGITPLFLVVNEQLTEGHLGID